MPKTTKAKGEHKHGSEKPKAKVITHSNVREAMDKAITLVKNAKKNSSGGFLAVTTDEKGRVTTNSVPSPAVAEVGMAREFMKNALGNRPYKTQLTINGPSAVGSAGIVFAVNDAIDICSSGEYPAFSSLFDEVRATSWRAHIIVGQSELANPVFMAAWGARPCVSAKTVGSLAEIVASTRHVGPIPFVQSLGAGGGQGPTTVAVTHEGHVTLESGPLMKSALAPATTGQNVPIQGDWIPTTSTTGQGVVGTVQFYGEGLGGTNVIIYRAIYVINVEFRLRS